MEGNEDFIPNEPLCDRLRKFRDLYSNEIPDEIIHGLEFKYKVRKNWFNGVAATLELMILTGQILEPELAREVKEFIDFCAKTLSKKQLTEKEDIDRGNLIINKVLASLG